MSPSFAAQTLSIEGADALAFAHAQFASDVTTLAVGHWQFSAWLDAQGRVCALFQLARLDEQRLLLLLRGGDAGKIATALRRYVLRSRVAIDIAPWLTIATTDAMPIGEVRVSTNGVTLGCGNHGMLLQTSGAGDDRWQSPQRTAGWPWLPPSTLDTLLPPALSLQRLHAVAIDKGCYPGQEIVARLHWRGDHKRRLCAVTFDQPLPPGASLRRDGHEIGVVLGIDDGLARCDALAVLSKECGDADASWMLDDDRHMHVQRCWET